MEILPEGEHSWERAAAAWIMPPRSPRSAGCASLIEFDPLRSGTFPCRPDWAFLVAHSLTVAEKSGAAREQYNARRAAGYSGSEAARIRLVPRRHRRPHPRANWKIWPRKLPSADEQRRFLHVTSEALRVRAAVAAMEQRDAAAFGALLIESHASLRDRLQVSCPALDRLVEAAMESGALGARLTGAGFGGCAVVFCRAAETCRPCAAD